MASYYETLGVPSDADADAIAQAYTDAVREATTADGGPGPRVRKLDEAYVVLSTPERRRRYDELRAAADGGGGNPELLALLAVIGEIGRLPTADEVIGPPAADRRPEAAPGAPPVRGPASPPRAQRDSVPSAPAPRPAEVDAPARPDPVPPDVAPEAGAPPPPARPTAATRAGPRVPGTDADRRALGRRRTAVAAALLGLLIGAGVGALLAGGGEMLPIEAGACVSLAADEGRAVPCTNVDADAVVRSMAEEPHQCEPSPAGYLVRADGRVACLAER